MSWSCSIKDKNGNDLLEKYGISHALYGICPPEELHNIRMRLTSPYDVLYHEQAKIHIQDAKCLIAFNIANLNKKHCEKCECTPLKPEGWTIEEAQKFLDLPLNEVYTLSAGY